MEIVPKLYLNNYHGHLTCIFHSGLQHMYACLLLWGPKKKTVKLCYINEVIYIRKLEK